MHGKFPNYHDKSHVDVELSFQWMKHTGLKEKLKDSPLQHRIRHSTPDTAASISSSKCKGMKIVMRGYNFLL